MTNKTGMILAAVAALGFVAWFAAGGPDSRPSDQPLSPGGRAESVPSDEPISPGSTGSGSTERSVR